MTTPPAIELSQASFAYDNGPVVLSDVTATVPAGTSVALLGSNGSGKSTLLKGLIGLLEPATGEVRVLGTTAHDARTRIAYLRQQSWSGRVAPMTVRDAVRIGRYARLGWFGRFTSADATAVDEALRRLGIEGLAGHSLHELSGGQRQRVQLAQAFAQQAEMLLLDEPFTGLDLPSQQQLVDLLAGEHQRGVTMVISTHELSVARSCDHVLLLAGRVIAAGPPAEVCTTANLTAAFGLLGEIAAEPEVELPSDGHDTQTQPTAPRVPARRDEPGT